MSKFQHIRDNILTGEERAASARKCINILSEADLDRLTEKEKSFLGNQRERADYVTYNPTEPQLQWLRDIVSKYCT